MDSLISLITRLQEEGIPDRELERRLKGPGTGSGWPEGVLARMQSAPAAVAQQQIEDPAIPERTAREMVMDLRREICTQTVEERELLHRMKQLLQDLILEVRDLRYAFILAASRKDRKRGRRNLSRLLSG